MDLINENIWYVAESEDEILQIPSPWLTMTLQARLAWGASTNCLRPELNWIFKKLSCDNCIHVDPQNFLWVNIEIIDPLVPKDMSRLVFLWSLCFLHARGWRFSRRTVWEENGELCRLPVINRFFSSTFSFGCHVFANTRCIGCYRYLLVSQTTV